ncbi:hypothetical protein BJY52DRAFT_504602 [Lactarius psammicola]|nr:hypothetical protein BJY52DRAFT_504602 [Lactarius psammicola]
MAHYNTFRVQLAIAHPALGHALWEPEPGEHLPPVEIGDVGFIRQGKFHRLFNALLPEDHPSHDTFRVPEGHEPLRPSMLNHVDHGTLYPNNFCSYGVRVTTGESAIFASGPPVPGSVDVSFSCTRKHGAVLSLPVAARREDTFAQAHFRRWITKHINSWFAFTQRHELGIEMEDIVLVTGCHRTRSWSNIAFYEGQADARVSFGVEVPGIYGTTVNWRVSSQHVQGAVLSRGPTGENLPENQCIFVRGFRVKRSFKIFPRVKGAAEPTPDPRGVDDELERVEVEPMATVPEYRDPLHVLLDYIAERAPHCDFVLVHDDDMERVLRVGDGNSLETLQPAEIMDYLQRSELEIGVAVVSSKHPSVL